jgi:hypothetical protein
MDDGTDEESTFFLSGVQHHLSSLLKYSILYSCLMCTPLTKAYCAAAIVGSSSLGIGGGTCTGIVVGGGAGIAAASPGASPPPPSPRARLLWPEACPPGADDACGCS